MHGLVALLIFIMNSIISKYGGESLLVIVTAASLH